VDTLDLYYKTLRTRNLRWMDILRNKLVPHIVDYNTLTLTNTSLICTPLILSVFIVHTPALQVNFKWCWKGFFMDCSIFFAATFVSGKPFQPCPTFLNIARSPLWRRLRKALGSLQRIRLVWQGLLGIDVLTYFAAPSLMDKNSIITLIPGPTETDLLR
jgi:hypothetical protein